MARFMALVRQMGAARRNDSDYRLYESLKRDFVRDFPLATQAEYEAAMRAISRAAGV
jgi:hypothetical protein